MNDVVYSVRRWLADLGDAWNRFWFTPSDPHTLAAIRILGGAMILYTHLVWTKDLTAFLGADSWIPADVSRQMQTDPEGRRYVWTYLWRVESPAVLWSLHVVALASMTLLTLGLFSRPAAIATWFFTICYCHRLQGALYGLDQVNAMVAMYLMFGPCGDVWSLDRWRQRRRATTPISAPTQTVGANVAIRLLQVHMAIIYLFGGISKLRGVNWWDGSACWLAVANLEYQSLDMTWLIQWPWLIAVLTHVTVFWETFYPVLVWPRLTRPVMLFLAVCVHGGIALMLGMKTFGLAMLIGNFAFVSPATVRWLVERATTRLVPTSEGVHARPLASAERSESPQRPAKRSRARA